MQEAIHRSVPHRLLDGIVRMSSTRTNYWAEFGFDLVLGSTLIHLGWRNRPGSEWGAVLIIALGLLAFSFVEYFFHRWMFHTSVPLFEEGHRTHHQKPMGYDSLPFFLPAVVVLMLTGLCMLVAPIGVAMLLMGTVAFGYIGYGLSHFAIHHVRFKHPLLRRWAASHHVHHYHPDSNFGVTTPLWDFLLGTRYVRQPRKL